MESPMRADAPSETEGGATGSSALGVENAAHTNLEMNMEEHDPMNDLIMDVPQLPQAIDNNEETQQIEKNDLTQQIENSQLPQIENNELPQQIENNERPKKRPRTPASRLVPKTFTSESDKLETNQVLLETASRMDFAISELIKYTNTLSDQTKENESKRHHALTNIRQSILPMMFIASRSMRDTGMAFAPFAGTHTLQKRNETKRKREIFDKTLDKSDALQMIDDFVRHSIVDIPLHITTAPELPTAKASTTTLKETIPEKKDTETISILRPHNETVYTKSEAVYTARLYRKGSQSRGMAVRAMVAQGYVPVGIKTIIRLVQQHEGGTLKIDDETWNGMGRPRKFERDPSAIRAMAAAAAAPKPVGRPSPERMIEVTMPKKSKKRQAGEIAEVVAVAVKGKSKACDKKKKDSAKRPKLPLKQSTKLPATKPPPAPKEQTPAPKEKTVPEQVKNFPLPEPLAGKVYNKRECVGIAKQYRKGSQERRWCIEAMVYKRYVLNCIKSIYRLLQKDEQGLPIPNTAWSPIGRGALITNDEVDVIIEKLKQAGGRIYGKADVEQILVNAAREKIVRQGGNPDESNIRFSNTTVNNYAVIFKSKLSGSYWQE